MRINSPFSSVISSDGLKVVVSVNDLVKIERYNKATRMVITLILKNLN